MGQPGNRWTSPRDYVKPSEPEVPDDQERNTMAFGACPGKSIFITDYQKQRFNVLYATKKWWVYI